ncbi:hypothetical protein CERSUDRAFT_100201 [Gelatoporia subvermispora B]|uniref:Uncharacterized protein n=1 Tax=Ceriporiopsis subvermispora (strain B) TaxID=914234 RepID=M2Q4K6_CERS8|nr:hypothetical protein CERSUDRAFT_100201 [Gelatoporia subvermispora B]
MKENGLVPNPPKGTVSVLLQGLRTRPSYFPPNDKAERTQGKMRTHMTVDSPGPEASHSVTPEHRSERGKHKQSKRLEQAGEPCRLLEDPQSTTRECMARPSPDAGSHPAASRPQQFDGLKICMVL